MAERDMILYEFDFIDQDGHATRKEIWASHHQDAWRKADDIAFNEGFSDYKMVEE